MVGFLIFNLLRIKDAQSIAHAFIASVLNVVISNERKQLIK